MARRILGAARLRRLLDFCTVVSFFVCVEPPPSKKGAEAVAFLRASFSPLSLCFTDACGFGDVFAFGLFVVFFFSSSLPPASTRFPGGSLLLSQALQSVSPGGDLLFIDVHL